MGDWYAGDRKDDCDGENEFCAARSFKAEIDRLSAEVARLSAEPDTETIERVAKALSAHKMPWREWASQFDSSKEIWRGLARAAIRALRPEGGEK